MDHTDRVHLQLMTDMNAVDDVLALYYIPKE